MLQATVGEIMVRVVQPKDNSPGYAQEGRVTEVTRETITLTVQTYIQKTIVFRRQDGFEIAGLGSFLVRSPAQFVEPAVPLTPKQVKERKDRIIAELAADLGISIQAARKYG